MLKDDFFNNWREKVDNEYQELLGQYLNHFNTLIAIEKGFEYCPLV